MPKALQRAITARERLFIEYACQGFTLFQAADKAGYKNPAAQVELVLNKRPELRAELEHRMKLMASRSFGINRESVTQMVLDAYDMAKIISDPGNMIKACGELSRMYGFYAPERQETTLSLELNQRKRQLESMSDEELLEAMSGRATVEGEFRLEQST